MLGDNYIPGAVTVAKSFKAYNSIGLCDIDCMMITNDVLVGRQGEGILIMCV